MKFFSDENIARAIVLWLRNKGYDVACAAEFQPGAPDTDWLREAQKNERVIITSDKDFGELIFRDHLNGHGVILLRMEELTVAERIERLQSAWSVVEANPIGKFIVITENKIRVRPLAIEKDDKRGTDEFLMTAVYRSWRPSIRAPVSIHVHRSHLRSRAAVR